MLLPAGPPKQLEELERLAGVGEDARWQKAKARFQDMMVNLDMGVSDEHKACPDTLLHPPTRDGRRG